MNYIQGEGRDQATLFSVVLDDFVPPDHVCRVIDAFAERLVMSELGFERAKAARRDGVVICPNNLSGSHATEFLLYSDSVHELPMLLRSRHCPDFEACHRAAKSSHA